MTVDAAPVRVLACSQGFPRHPADHHAAFVLDHARMLALAGADVEVSCPSAPGLPVSDVYPTPVRASAEDPGARSGGIRIHRFRYAPRRLETLAYSGGMHHRAKGPGALLLPTFLLGFLVDVVRRSRRADVIHAHWWLPSGVVAVLAGRITRTPVVVQLHGTDVAMARGPLRLLARWVLRRADAVVAVSGALGDWARRVADVEPVVLPMPLRTSLADGLDRAWVPPPADGPVLGIGRLVPEKGFDVLVRAAAEAGMPVVFVGTGSEQPRLAALAAELGADVTFAGPVSPDEVGEYYRSARLVAVPSRREGFGLVAAEALACGRAVVASDVGGLCSVVLDGVTGALVPADDVPLLAAALRRCDPGLGEAGPASVGWIAPAGIGAATLELYERVVAPRAG